ncbi:MAG: DUF2846 domain-containing protein [Porticoccaceae bacterium]
MTITSIKNRIMMKIRILTILCFMLLAGCAATGQKFPGITAFSEATSTLYIFRESKLQSAAYCPAMYLEGKKVGCLKNGGYIRVEISPGKHLLEVRKSAFLIGDEPSIEFSSSSGEVIFIEWTTSIVDIMVTPAVGIAASEWLVQRSKIEASNKLKNLNES